MNTQNTPTDTPRTDAESECISNAALRSDLVFVVPSDHARTLERELTAMTAERDALRAALENLMRSPIPVANWYDSPEACGVALKKHIDAVNQATAALNHRKP